MYNFICVFVYASYEVQNVLMIAEIIKKFSAQPRIWCS